MKDSSREDDRKTRLHPGRADSGRQTNHVQRGQRLSGRQPIKVGTTLNDRFVLEELIALGGMGVVFKAKDLRKVEAMDRNPYVAIKVLNEDFKSHPESWIALQREARKSQQLAHPNIITVYDFDRDGGTYYMTMELLEGESLGSLIERMPRDGLNFTETIAIVEGIARALSYAHKKRIIHSDIKPSNVFMTRDNVIKVLDFGIARAIKKPGQGEDRTVFDPVQLGALTPAYASFEMIERASPDPRDDVYALACITYELLAHRHPFERRTSLQAYTNSLKPKRVEKLTRKQWQGLKNGLALRQQNRTQTIDAFFKQLQTPDKSKSISRLASILGFFLLIPIFYYGYSLFEQQSTEKQIAEVESLLDSVRLSSSQVESASSRLKELMASKPNDPRLGRLRDNIAMAYLNLAKEAGKRGKVEAAINYLRLGRKQTVNEEIVAALDSALGELELRIKTMASLVERFQHGFEETPSTSNGIRLLLATLDQLSRIDPGHPLIEEGKQSIEEKIITLAGQYGQQKLWRRGLQLIEESRLALPESTAFEAIQKELQVGYQMQVQEDKANKSRQLTAIRARKARIEKMLDISSFTAERRHTIDKELAQLKALLPADDPWLTKTYTALNALEEKQYQTSPHKKWEILPNGAEKTD